MRPLTLHVSALSDAEYDLYTTSLSDLATDSTDGNTPITSHVRDDARYERTSVGTREARAWLRGRYSDLPAADIDAILRLFCPHMLPSDTLTGGQFFTALRLAVHAQSGKGVDRTLAFVQASPKTAKVPEVPRPHSPPKRPVQAPPAHPDRQKPLPVTTPPPETNPFTRRSMEHAAALPPPAPPQDPEPTTTMMPLMPMLSQQRLGKLSHNPFLVRDKPDVGPDKAVSAPNHGRLPPLPPRKPSLLATGAAAAAARRPSEALPTPVTSTAHLTLPSGPPLIPAKPTHVMSPLMRQSLEASKHAQSMKRAEEQLDRERVLQVIKTSSSSSSISNNNNPQMPNARTRSLSPAKPPPGPNGHGHDGAPSSALSVPSDDATYVPPLPRRRKPSLPSSASSSALSLEQVASAKLPSPAVATPPFKPPPPLPSRDALHVDTLGLPAVAPPPTHPYRRPSAASTEPTVNDTTPPPSPSSSSSSPARVARSKSVTSSSTRGLPPPPRRKRPESMHVRPGKDDLPPFFHPSISAQTQTQAHAHAQTHGRTISYHGYYGHGLSRHPSLTREREHERAPESSPIANIQRTLTNLQLKAQPKLDAVRYKAEAGISKRGYIHHHQHTMTSPGSGGGRWREEGEEGLMADTRWAATDVNVDTDSAPTTDDEPSSGEDPAARSQRTTGAFPGPHRDSLRESDGLKWPVGEGWKPL